MQMDQSFSVPGCSLRDEMLLQVTWESLLLPFSGLWIPALGCASVCPSILPVGASLHPHPSVHPPLPWGRQLAWLKCMSGEILPVFLTREPAGGCRVCLQLPGALHAQGFLQPGILAKTAPWSVSCWQCPSLAPKCVSIFICPGDGGVL